MKLQAGYVAAALCVLVGAQAPVRQARPAKRPAAPFRYVQATAYHILPETTTEESGYFSLCEGKNGKIYVGCAAYGRDSYLVEFDPATEKMQIVLDTNKVVGLPLVEPEVHTSIGFMTHGSARASRALEAALVLARDNGWLRHAAAHSGLMVV